VTVSWPFRKEGLSSKFTRQVPPFHESIRKERPSLESFRKEQLSSGVIQKEMIISRVILGKSDEGATVSGKERLFLNAFSEGAAIC
jgi:hypothetical protein